MPRINDSFQHDVFRFVIESRRNDLLSRWLGEPGLINPESSVQGHFERIQARIKELPELLDPSFGDAELRLLAWVVGWDDRPEVAFIDDLSDVELRKLIRLSVPLWKQKGAAEGLINAIRVFTGKTALVQDWFWHRWIIDEAGFWVEAQGADPYLVGGRYTEGDAFLTWVIINRDGVGESQRRLVYDLLTFIRVAGEHYGVIYAGFADNFAAGFAQWTQIGTPGTLVVNEGDYRGGLLEGASIKAAVTDAEAATWTPFLRAIVYAQFESITGTSYLEAEVMRSADGVNHYRARITDTGEVELYLDGVSVAGPILFTPPVAGTPIGFEIRVEPVNTAETKVSILVGNVVLLDHTFLGDEAYVVSDGGLVINRGSVVSNAETVYIDNVILLASPNRIQFIGQQAITPTPGLGGPVYIADPDPGVEPFAG